MFIAKTHQTDYKLIAQICKTKPSLNSRGMPQFINVVSMSAEFKEDCMPTSNHIKSMDCVFDLPMFASNPQLGSVQVKVLGIAWCFSARFEELHSMFSARPFPSFVSFVILWGFH